MGKSKYRALAIITLLLFSFVVGLATAQIFYPTIKTTDLDFDSNGNCTVYETSIGVTYIVQGTPGSTGSVTASIYPGNPQATANIPDDVSLSHFIIFTFDMDPSDFTQAQISLSYSDDDIANLHAPYAIYKYLPDSNSYVPLYTIVDTTAKTMTITLTSLNDPLLAIGGSTVEEDSGIGVTSWIIIVVSVIVIVVLALFMVIRWRKM
jgi:flagellar basal body-associated protein FliL